MVLAAPGEGVLLTSSELARPVRNRDLLLIHEIEELASLARCLESPVCTQYFCVFLKDEYAVESVLFLQEVRAYRLESERLIHHARQIYSLFLNEDAVNQVAVDSALRRHTNHRFQRSLPHLADLFAPVETELIAALSRDHFPRFLQSLHCMRLLKHLTLERQALKRRAALRPRNADGSLDLSTDPPELEAQEADALLRNEQTVRLEETELQELRAAIHKDA
jgi:hypothetical protein